MMSPSESFIYFGCPRCTARLRAPVRNVGQRRRCPLCQYGIVVPRESLRTDYEEYTFRDNAAPAGNTEPEIAFDCPICHTRMTAPKEQVGQKAACPDCRTSVTVPAKSAPRRRNQPAPLDDYALCEDYNPASPPAPQAEFIAVYCGRCGTLMQVAPDRLGSEITCPDCRAAKVVQTPRMQGKRDIPPTVESYEVHEESGQPPPTSVAHQEHVGFVCRCGTRLHALVAEVGQQLICPACGRSVTVPSPSRKQPARDPTKEIEGQYETKAAPADEKQEFVPYRPPLWFSGRFSKMLDKHGRLPPEPRPPRWPLVSGVFTFPWHRGSLGKWLSLSMAAILIAMIGLFNVFFVMLAECLAVCWAGVLFVNLLAILGDTAAGADDVGHWPNAAAFIDWVGNTFFVINSLALSMTTGYGLGLLLQLVKLPHGYAMIGVPVLLFPLVLLSMLEVNSPLVPLSKPVCRSLVVHWRAWIGFYLESILLLGATGIALAAVFSKEPLLAIPVFDLTLVASSMIYFRLLGRLAWCCAR